MSSINRREALALTGGAATSLFAPHVARADDFFAPAKVVCGSVPYVSSGGFFIPVAKGYYKKLGLDVEVRTFVDGGLSMPALAAGEIDVSTAPCNAGFFNMVAKGTPVRIFMDRGHEAKGRGSQGILVSNALHAAGFTDLDGYKMAKGKMLSLSVMGSVAHYLHARALERVGLKLSDLDVRNGLNSNAALQLMASGKIDIVLDPMPGAFAAQEKGAGKIVAWSDEIAPGMQTQRAALRLVDLARRLVAQRQLAHERTREAFGSDPLHVVLGALAALGFDGESAIVHADVDGARVDAGQVGVQHEMVTCPEQIHRHEARRAGCSGLGAKQLLGQTVDVAERVETEHGTHLLHTHSPWSGGCFRALLLLALSAREC